jgi:hypothetical protein
MGFRTVSFESPARANLIMWREEGKGYHKPCGDSAKVFRAALLQAVPACHGG